MSRAVVSMMIAEQKLANPTITIATDVDNGRFEDDCQRLPGPTTVAEVVHSDRSRDESQAVGGQP